MSVLTSRVTSSRRADERPDGPRILARRSVRIPHRFIASTGESSPVTERPRQLPGDNGAAARHKRIRDAERRHLRLLHATDLVMTVVAGVGSYLVHLTRFGSNGPLLATHLITTAVFPVLWLILVASMRAYEPRFLHAGTEEFRRVVNAGIGLALAGSLFSYALQVHLARGYLLTLVVFATGCTIAGRLALRLWLHRQRASGVGWMRRVVVAGHGDDVSRVARELGRTRSHGYEVAAVCLAEDTPAEEYDVPVTAGLEKISDVVATTGADGVIVLPCRHFGPAALRRLGWQLERSGTHLLVAPGLLDVARQRTTIAPVGALPLLHVDHAELTGGRRIAKDVFDRVSAALALLVIAPVILALMLAIRLESPGPAIFRQVRVGKDDRRFTVLKLRTMAVDAEDRVAELAALNESDGALFKMRADPRITKIGKVLRRFSLDELPQLFNVVLGQMSLVGPRPPLPSEVDQYEQDVRRRLVVKPGLTGLWQVSGRSDLPWDEAVRLDLRYVDNWSLALDLQILWKTGRAVLSRSGAY